MRTATVRGAKREPEGGNLLALRSGGPVWTGVSTQDGPTLMEGVGRTGAPCGGGQGGPAVGLRGARIGAKGPPSNAS